MNFLNGFRGIVLGSTFQLNDDDVVVFLVGPMESGKSAFMNDVTKSGIVVVGQHFRPSTKTPQAIRCELTDKAKRELHVSSQKNIVFVDTPSFHTGGPDLREGADREMGKWLNKAVKFRSTRIGTIYMHRIETDPGHEPIQLHLDTFAHTLPQSVVSYALPERLHAVFSSQGIITQDKMDRHRASFEEQLRALRPSIVHRKVLRWDTSLDPQLFWRPGNPETAWEVVVTLFSTSRIKSGQRPPVAPEQSSTTLPSFAEPKKQPIRGSRSGHQESTKEREGSEAEAEPGRRGTNGRSQEVIEPVSQPTPLQNPDATQVQSSSATRNDTPTPLTPPRKQDPQAHPVAQNLPTQETLADSEPAKDDVPHYPQTNVGRSEEGGEHLSDARSQLDAEPQSDEAQKKIKSDKGPGVLSIQSNMGGQYQTSVDEAGSGRKPHQEENPLAEISTEGSGHDKLLTSGVNPTNSRKKDTEGMDNEEGELGEMDNQLSRLVAVPLRDSQAIGNKDYARTGEEAPPEAEEAPEEVSVEDLKEDHIVIAVMGPTGAGKSTLISIASGIDKNVIGHSLKSFTSKVQAIKFRDKENGRHVVLVDTPGFDDTSKSDLDILTMISKWLNSSYDTQKQLSGILYLHRITDNRMAGTPLKNLRMFEKLCGDGALDKVYFTTTMWDEVTPDVGERRLEELKTEYWNTMLEQGAQTYECRSMEDSKRLIQDIVFKDEERRFLQLQEEMGREKMKLKETTAGRYLFSELEQLVVKQSELLQRIAKERKAAASDPEALAELQEEYIQLREQVDNKLRQMEQLKLTWFKSIMRLPRIRFRRRRG